MQIDFYQLAAEPVEAMLPPLAAKCLASGGGAEGAPGAGRLLVVAGDAALRTRLSTALWAHGRETFLAHGEAGGPHDARQPILLSPEPVSANGARMVALADGIWREMPAAAGIARVFLFFDAATLGAARQCWRMLAARDGVARRFWKRQGPGWVEGP